jgi:hypothetical protein
MTPPAIRRLLIGVLVVGVTMNLVSLGLSIHVKTSHPGVPVYDYLVEGAIGGLFLYALSLLMALRRPDHPVTWALVASGVFSSIQGLLGTYAVESLLAVPDRLPLGALALAGSSVAQLWFVLGFVLTINLFPTGRPLSGRWKWVVWGLLPGSLVGASTVFFAPMEIGATAVGPLIESDLKPVVDAANIALAGFVILGTIGHVVARFVRSKGVERQQLKWFVFSLVVGIVVLVMPWTEDDTIGAILWTVVPVAVLGSMALAILRYGLYEIDRIISRTITYALVVGLLGLFVLALVTGLALFMPSDDPLVVAVATLVAFASFNPLRRRVQRLVDRRFNRSRYDAQRVIDDFAGTLRHRVDPEEVVDGWLGVVSETMQPAAAGVWVKQP